MSTPKEFGVAVFHHIGDVLAATPIAKQLKADYPDCKIVWFTSEAGEVAVRLNPYIDELVVLPGNAYLLDHQIPQIRQSRPWTRFFTPAAYMNYEVIPGGSILDPKGTIFGITKQSAMLHWTVPFTFPFRLDTSEIAAARAYLDSLPDGMKILVETDYRSEQSPWTDDWCFDMLEELHDLNATFIFTSKNPPPFFDSFQKRYPNCSWCDLPFRLNAEIFNHCDAFIGVSSGISCLTYSDYCKTTIPRIEVTRGEHWGAAELSHHTELYLCYSRLKYREALKSVHARLADWHTVADFTPRFDPTIRYLGHCPYCNGTERVPVRANGVCECKGCGAHYATRMTAQPASDVRLDLIGSRCVHLTADEFLAADIAANSFRTAHVSGNIGTVSQFREFLEKIQWALKENGTLDISAFNFEGVVSRTLVMDWPWLRPDQTLWYFSPRFFREAIIQAGFIIERGVTDSPEDSAAALLEVLPKLNKELQGAELARAFEQVNKRGAGNVIQVTARKRGGFKGRVALDAVAARSDGAHTVIAGDSDLVSIVVPCHNGRRHVEDLVRSVLNQTYLNWELIIVDDGSTDGSAAAAQQIGGQFPSGRIRVVQIEHVGAAEARDVGCALAEGSWLLPLDVDDRLASNCLERMLQAAKAASDASIIFSQHEQFGLGQKFWSPGEMSTADILRGVPYPSTVLMKRDCWYAIGGYNIGSPLSLSAYHLWLAIVSSNYGTVYIEEPLVKYCTEHSGQLHHAVNRHWRLARAFVRTAHSDLFTFDELNEEHRVIGSMGGWLETALDRSIETFPGLPTPYLWRGLLREQNGLLEAALSDSDAANRRRKGEDWQAGWRKALASALAEIQRGHLPVEEQRVMVESKRRELHRQFRASLQAEIDRQDQEVLARQHP